MTCLAKPCKIIAPAVENAPLRKPSNSRGNLTGSAEKSGHLRAGSPLFCCAEASARTHPRAEAFARGARAETHARAETPPRGGLCAGAPRAGAFARRDPRAEAFCAGAPARRHPRAEAFAREHPRAEAPARRLFRGNPRAETAGEDHGRRSKITGGDRARQGGGFSPPAERQVYIEIYWETSCAIIQ